MTERLKTLKALFEKFKVEETVPPAPFRIAPLVVVGTPLFQLAALVATSFVPIHVV